MHAIKHQARNIAWRYGDEENTNYNPFAKRSRSYIRNKSLGDEENGLRKHNTADQVETAEQRRRREEHMAASEFDPEPPVHSNTAPTASRSSYPPAANGQAHAHNPLTHSSPLAVVDEKDVKDVTRSGDDSSRSLPESHTELQQNGAQPEGTRKRKKFFGILGRPGHGGEDKEDGLERLDTEEEKKRQRFKKKIPAWTQIKATLFGSWINVLLICSPVGFAINYAHLDGKANFVVNFIAIIPLAAMLSFATEELAMYTGETLGGLLNASFGNATELIVGIIALKQSKILIVQTSLIGSMLSNLLLVLVAQTAASMLALSIGSLIIPTAFVQFGNADAKVTQLSDGTSVLLLLVYASYLLFQLKTHNDIYNRPSEKSEKRKRGKKEQGEVIMGLARMGAGSAAAAGGQVNQSNLVQEPDEEEEEPTLTIFGALGTLCAATVLIAFNSEFMVSGIDAIVAGGTVSEEFVGLILIPIVGNAAEHATAVTVAIKDKMDLAIGVAVGSSMQIALLVLPLMVIIGWCGLGNQNPPMNLDFDGFQVAVLFIAVLLVNYLIQDGESHWLEGVLLMTLYLIIAVSAWFYPATGVI
ncbi:hypothetical protein MBLNU459_g1342t1 [Dothideomycetes sp. NU459]